MPFGHERVVHSYGLLFHKNTNEISPLWDKMSRSAKGRGAVQDRSPVCYSSTTVDSFFIRSDSGPHKAA